MEYETFYATAAQVLPVMLLAFAFEHRIIDMFREAEKEKDRTRETRFAAVAMIVNLTLWMLGESAALLALADNGGNELSRTLVIIGLSSSIMMVVYPLASSPGRILRDSMPDRFRRWYEVAVFVFWIVALIAVVIYTVVITI